MTTAALAAASAFIASGAHAQSSVTLYGEIDAGLAYTNNAVKGNNHGSLIQQTTGEINGSRWGLRGAENLGDGLQAIFVLENGFGVNNGALKQDNKLFGRQAYVGLSSTTWGTLMLGNTYDMVTEFIEPISAEAGTEGDTGFTHVFDNDNFDHDIRESNTVKYLSNNYGGFTFGGHYAFSNSSEFALNREYSLGAGYNYGPFRAGAAYLQINGLGSTNPSGAIDVAQSGAQNVGGFQLNASVWRVAAAAFQYTYGPAILGFAYSHSQFQDTTMFGSNGGHAAFDNYEFNAKYFLTHALSLVGSYTYTDAHVTQTSTFGNDPKWNQFNFQVDYAFSKRTDVYAEGMYQHATGHDYVAFINASGGASSTANQVVATIGMRHRF